MVCATADMKNPPFQMKVSSMDQLMTNAWYAVLELAWANRNSPAAMGCKKAHNLTKQKVYI